MTATRDPVKSVRIRYLIGLSALAVLILGAHFLLVRVTADRQGDYGRLINVAGNQVGLMNRIAFFASEMQRAPTADDFVTARQQVGRAIDLMARRHEMLVYGDPSGALPAVDTPLLRTLYHDPGFGLDKATRHFLQNARSVYKTEFGRLQDNTAALVYVRNYGPYVLETLLNAAVDEYERFSRDEMRRLMLYQEIAVAAALLLLLIEAIFIFRPLEARVRDAFQAVRRKNADLEAARVAAEDANRAKSRFLSNMSHELRTPLNAILGFSDAMREGVYGPLACERQRERLGDVHAAAEHLLRLVNDVLELNRLESERVTLEEGPVDPRALIERAFAVMQPLADARGLRLERQVEAGDFDLWGDERRLLQVLLNLVGNAVRYCRAGGAVQAVLGREGAGGVVLQIKDEGEGMTAEECDIALSRFGRTDGARAAHPDGAGLGLPISAELVALHGGALSLHSEKGRGTVATLRLPGSRVRAAQDASAGDAAA